MSHILLSVSQIILIYMLFITLMNLILIFILVWAMKGRRLWCFKCIFWMHSKICIHFLIPGYLHGSLDLADISISYLFLNTRFYPWIIFCQFCNRNNLIIHWNHQEYIIFLNISDLLINNYSTSQSPALKKVCRN